MHGLVALMEIQASRARARSRSVGRADRALRAEPRALGSAPIRRGLAALDARQVARRRRGSVRAPGRDRRLPRAGAHAGGDGLGAHRGALRRARAAHAVAGRRAEPRRRGRAWPSARRRASRSSMRWPRSRRFRATISCRACAATCLPSSAALDEARAEFERAAALTRNARERELLLARARAGRRLRTHDLDDRCHDVASRCPR